MVRATAKTAGIGADRHPWGEVDLGEGAERDSSATGYIGEDVLFRR